MKKKGSAVGPWALLSVLRTNSDVNQIISWFMPVVTWVDAYIDDRKITLICKSLICPMNLYITVCKSREPITVSLKQNDIFDI